MLKSVETVFIPRFRKFFPTRLYVFERNDVFYHYFISEVVLLVVGTQKSFLEGVCHRARERSSLYVVFVFPI